MRDRNKYIQRAPETRTRGKKAGGRCRRCLPPPLFQSSSIIPLTLISLVPKRLSRILRKLMPMLETRSKLSGCCCLDDRCNRRRRGAKEKAFFLVAGAGQLFFFLCRRRRSEDVDGLSKALSFLLSRASVLRARGQQNAALDCKFSPPRRRFRCRATPT